MGANSNRWYNMQVWLSECDGDYDLAERSAYFAEIRYPSVRRFTDGTKPPGQRKGATLADNKSRKTMTENYCRLQFLKLTIEDQQRIILEDLEKLAKNASVGRQAWYTFISQL